MLCSDRTVFGFHATSGRWALSFVQGEADFGESLFNLLKVFELLFFHEREKRSKIDQVCAHPAFLAICQEM